MGLDTSHNAFHGPYSQFNVWRHWLAEQIGIPLELMEGFYYDDAYHNPFIILNSKFPNGDELEMSGLRRLQKKLPLLWDAFKPSPLHKLLYHSDCDGDISYKDCGAIAKVLKELLSKIKDDSEESRSPTTERGCYDGMYNCTKRFMEGCELAFKEKKKLLFT